MAFNIGDIFKDHKKILLSAVGILALVVVFGVVLSSNPDLFQFSSNLDGSTGVGNIVDSQSKQYEKEPDMTIDQSKDYFATVSTNYGTFEVDLFEKETPKTVNHFVKLASDGFYNGLKFHRVIADFVIQGGDPKGTGQGGPGYSFEDEIDASALGLGDLMVRQASYLSSFYSESQLKANANISVKQFYESLGYRYTSGKGAHHVEAFALAMANSGPNTNGSQFFIPTRGFSGTYLDGKHTVFGEVSSGFSVIDSIERVSTNQEGVPLSDVLINSVKIYTK